MIVPKGNLWSRTPRVFSPFAFPLVDLKGVYHYRTDFIFSRGLEQMVVIRSEPSLKGAYHQRKTHSLFFQKAQAMFFCFWRLASSILVDQQSKWSLKAKKQENRKLTHTHTKHTPKKKTKQSRCTPQGPQQDTVGRACAAAFEGAAAMSQDEHRAHGPTAQKAVLFLAVKRLNPG